MKVAIIILHFGEKTVTQECIKSLLAHETVPFTIIVVNNAEKSFGKKDFGLRKQDIVITNKKNLGFAKGVNIGIRYALSKQAQFICLLNNDTHIIQPILTSLINSCQGSIGITAPVLTFYKDKKKLYDIGGKINKIFLRTSHKEVLVLPIEKNRLVAYASGCCMLIKAEVFKKTGFFDEKFFLYYEDADFCLRAQKKGYKCVIVTKLIVKHDLSKSAGNMSSIAIYYLLQSGIYFGKKYAKSNLQKIAHRLFILVQSVLFLRANPYAGVTITKVLLNG